MNTPSTRESKQSKEFRKLAIQGLMRLRVEAMDAQRKAEGNTEAWMSYQADIEQLDGEMDALRTMRVINGGQA